MKTIRIFLLRTDVCPYRGKPPARSKNGVHFPWRKSRLVSHPTEHLFKAPDKFDAIGERCLYWHWIKQYQDTPALFFINGSRSVLRNAAQNFQGNSPELCKVAWETIRQRRIYLGNVTPWDDAHEDIELTPFDENIPHDISAANPLPLPVLDCFLKQSPGLDRTEFFAEAGYENTSI